MFNDTVNYTTWIETDVSLERCIARYISGKSSQRTLSYQNGSENVFSITCWRCELSERTNKISLEVHITFRLMAQVQRWRLSNKMPAQIWLTFPWVHRRWSVNYYFVKFTQSNLSMLAEKILYFVVPSQYNFVFSARLWKSAARRFCYWFYAAFRTEFVWMSSFCAAEPSTDHTRSI